MLMTIERNSTPLIETAPPTGLNNGRGAKETKGNVERRKRCSAEGLHNTNKRPAGGTAPMACVAVLTSISQ